MSPRSITRSKLQSGQGLVEYALILVLVLVVVFVSLTLIFGINRTPPPINAPIQDVLDYCQSQAEYSTTVMVGDVPITTHHFDDNKFNSCLAKYEYKIGR